MRTVRRILVIAGLLSGSPAFAEQPLAAGECETLQTLVDETRNDFAQVRQAPIEARKWHVSPELPGYRTCYLQKTKRIAYTVPLEDAGRDRLTTRPCRTSPRQSRAEARARQKLLTP